MKIFLCLDLCSTLCSAIWESKLIVVPDQSSWRFLLLLWDWRLRLLLLPLPRCLRLGLDSSDPDEFELRLRFLFAWLTMACKGLPDSFRFMSVERFFEIMIVIILIIFFFYVLLFLFGWFGRAVGVEEYAIFVVMRFGLYSLLCPSWRTLVNKQPSIWIRSFF